MTQDVFSDENGKLMKEIQKKKLTVEGHEKPLYTTRHHRNVRFCHFQDSQTLNSYFYFT